MSSLDFIIDGIRFSYSSLNTYHTCPWCFKLTYIDREDRVENYFAQYGLLIHETLEKYFSGELDIFELTSYYEVNYNYKILTPPPPYPPGMEDRYKKAGIDFFNSFSFDRERYDILLDEDTIEFDFTIPKFKKIAFTARPDLVLFNKEKGDFSLYDFKTSAPFRVDKRSGKEIVDQEKLDGYYRQMYLYAYAIRNYRFIPLDEITLWFTRPSRRETVSWCEKDEKKALTWLGKTVKDIYADEEFQPNTSSPYFCNNLCSVRDKCIFKPEM